MSFPRRSEVVGRLLDKGVEVRDAMDGVVVPGYPWHGTPNPVMRLEPGLKKVCAPF